MERAAYAEIADLTKRHALGAYGDLAARHLWDEYFWKHQRDPFGDGLDWDGVSLGSSASAFENLAWNAAMAELDCLPRNVLALLIARAFELSSDFEGWDEREAISRRIRETLAVAKPREVKLGKTNGAKNLRRAGKGGVALRTERIGKRT